MEAVSLAPTAVNQQKFLFELKNGKGAYKLTVYFKYDLYFKVIYRNF